MCGFQSNLRKEMPMNFKEFESEVLRYFRETLGEEYTISINEVRKNNNIIRNGLLMKKRGQSITPNIYLNRFYEQYIEGEELQNIVDTIWSTYVEALQSFDAENFKFELDLEQQKDKIVYRLVSYQENEEKLKQLPHIRFLDLAITFYCFVELREETLSMVCISHEMAKRWKTDVKGLLAYAHQNTPRLFPIVCNSLENVIRHMLNDERFEELFCGQEDEVTMYVVTNESGINGATVMLYEDAFHEIAQNLGGKLIILPSSIHELILIPFDEAINTDYLVSLVKEVNLTQVPWEDVLSNNIYLYDFSTKSFEIL